MLLNNLHGRIRLNAPFLAVCPKFITNAMCKFSVALEFSGPLLSVWGPNGSCRTVMVMLFLAFHTGISVHMNVGAFFCSMFAVILPLLPSQHLIVCDPLANKFFGPLRNTLFSWYYHPTEAVPDAVPIKTATENKFSCGAFCGVIFKVFATIYSFHVLLGGVVVNSAWMADQTVQNYTTADGTNSTLISQQNWVFLFKTLPEAFFPDSYRFAPRWMHWYNGRIFKNLQNILNVEVAA